MIKSDKERPEEIRRPILNEVIKKDSQILVNGHQYELIFNYRDAFEEDQLADRFINLLSRYDYLVGDIASGQLRLRGFFENYEDADLTINRLQDYLFEDCGFGCPYFVLKNLEVNVRARQRWEKDQRNGKEPTKPSKSVNHRKNEFVGKRNTKKSKFFKIRAKKEESQ